MEVIPEIKLFWNDLSNRDVRSLRTRSSESMSLLPERTEKLLPERHETITFCIIWRSVSVATAASIETSPIHRSGQTVLPELQRSLPTGVAHRPMDRPWADLGQPMTVACDAGTPTPFASIFHCRRNSSSSSWRIQSQDVLNVNS
jgi:hypothetical protein